MVVINSATGGPMLAPHATNLDGVHSRCARCDAGMCSGLVMKRRRPYAHMAGDASITVEDLDHLGRGAHIYWFMDQLVRHRVVAGIELHVVIDVHLARLPLGKLEGCSWQRLERSTFELVE